MDGVWNSIGMRVVPRAYMVVIAIAVAFALMVFGGTAAWADEPVDVIAPDAVSAVDDETAGDVDAEVDQDSSGDDGSADAAVAEPATGDEGQNPAGDELSDDPRPAAEDDPDPEMASDDSTDLGDEPAVQEDDPAVLDTTVQQGATDEAASEADDATEGAPAPQVTAAATTAKPTTTQPAATTQTAPKATTQKASPTVKAQATRVDLSRVSLLMQDPLLSVAKDDKEIEHYLEYKGNGLVKGKDYKVTFSNLSKAGKGTATFTGIGKYAGTVKKAYEIFADPYPGERWWYEHAFGETYVLRMPLNSTCTSFKNVVFDDVDDTGKLKISGSTLKAVKTGTTWLWVNDLRITGKNHDMYDIGMLSDRFKVVVYKPAGEYVVKSALGNGLALDVAAGSTANGANVQVYKANGTKAQSFKLVDAGSGAYTFVNAKSGKALDVAAASKSNGANVQQYKRNGTAAQKWRIKVDYTGKLTFVNVGSGKVLDVAAGKAANGTNVQQYSSNGSKAQKWTLSAVPSSYKTGATKMYVNSTSKWTLTNARLKVLSGTAVKVSGGTVTGVAKGKAVVAVLNPSGKVLAKKTVTVTSLGSGTYGITSALKTPDGFYTMVNTGWPVKSGSNERVSNEYPDSFKFVKAGDAFLLVDSYSGLALDVAGASKADGANVQLYKRNNTAAQKWKLVIDAKNLVTFINVASGKALDIAGGKYAKQVDSDGWTTYSANLQQYKSNGTKAQKWTLDCWDY